MCVCVCVCVFSTLDGELLQSCLNIALWAQCVSKTNTTFTKYTAMRILPREKKNLFLLHRPVTGILPLFLNCSWYVAILKPLCSNASWFWTDPCNVHLFTHKSVGRLFRSGRVETCGWLSKGIALFSWTSSWMVLTEECNGTSGVTACGACVSGVLRKRFLYRESWSSNMKDCQL